MKKETKKNKKMIWVLAALAVLAICVSWYRLPRNQDVPDELIGVWRTSAEKYADRNFEITLTSVNFGTGAGTVSTSFIQKIEVAAEGDRTLYTFSYLQDGKECQWSFYYEAARGKGIRFKNQDSVVWTKQGS